MLYKVLGAKYISQKTNEFYYNRNTQNYSKSLNDAYKIYR